MTMASLLSILLSVAFGTAAIAKAAGIAGFRRTLNDLDLPPSATAVFVVLIPLAEAIGSVGLLVPALHLWAAGFLLLLLAGFAGAAVKAMRKEWKVVCNCYGAWSQESFGYGTLIRIAVLATLLACLIGAREPQSWGDVSLREFVSVIAVSFGLLTALPLYREFASWYDYITTIAKP